MLVPLSGDDASHKRRQAEFFDAEADPDYETVRPHGSPRWHRWLLQEKFRRGISELGAELSGATVLTVCGGSGMDAEFLERAGAGAVVSSDLSLGAARRTRQRAELFGLQLQPVVADVECLPFEDRAFDVVFVHDGLHHLEDPVKGLMEMARVARRAVSVNEPAAARATRMAVRAGLSIDYEEAGNRVARLGPEEVTEPLAGAGFEVVSCSRYAMVYRHEPGLPTRLLSLSGMFALGRAGWRFANALIGRIGNKLAIQAVRRDST